MENNRISPPATHILPLNLWVLFQFSSLFLVQEMRIPKVRLGLIFGR